MPALMYGTRSNHEAAVVGAIFAASERGLSAEEIAGVLNARGIPSPGGMEWKGRAVRRLLLDHRLREQINGEDET
jgi:chromosome segregation and condensation protein ScpB